MGLRLNLTKNKMGKMEMGSKIRIIMEMNKDLALKNMNLNHIKNICLIKTICPRLVIIIGI